MSLPTYSDYTAIREAHGKVTRAQRLQQCQNHQIPHKPHFSTAYTSLSSMHQKAKSYYHQHTTLLLLLFTLFGLVFQGSDGVKDVQLQGPRYARISEDLMLRCNYDLETDSLYAVKWYRGSEEFYRFLPKESPPKQTFPITGILVDVNKSDDRNVFLKNISFETNGRFKCVISAEGTFQTLENAKDIDIVVIDYNSPKLFLDKMNYQPGDRGLANCTIEKTFPVPNITWFINGKQVNNISVMTRTESVVDVQGRRATSSSGGGFSSSSSSSSSSYSSGGGRGIVNKTVGGGNDVKNSKLTSSVSTLLFPISSYSPLTIKCTGQLYDVYNETSSIQIQPKAPLIYPYPTLSTPKSQHKYGMMPDQLQTYNATRYPNDGVQPSACPTLLLLAATTTLITAQFFLFSQQAIGRLTLSPRVILATTTSTLGQT